MAKQAVHKRQIGKVSGDQMVEEEDLLVIEEPLEIRLTHGSGDNRKQDRIAVTMRTPGHDFELAAGFLFTEGIIQEHSQIKAVRYCLEIKDPLEEGNVVIVELDPETEVDLKLLERNFYMSSSCGVCGKSSIESIHSMGCKILPDDDFQVDREFIQALPTLANANQTVFKHTGGLHAAVLFDENQNIIFSREDVGRHNAVDKVIGAMLAVGSIPSKGKVLFLSGRAGFELVQKCVVAGISIVAAVGAPSSLAAQLAEDYNLTLMGFVRNQRFNIYTGNQRFRKS